MKSRKLLAIVCFCAILIAIAYICLCVDFDTKKAGNLIHNQIYEYLAGYPQSVDPYSYSEFYISDGEIEYFVLQIGEKRLLGMRTEVGDTVYYLDGTAWILDENGTPVELLSYDNTILSDVEVIVKQYMNDSSVSYSRKVARSLPYPLWVSGGEEYLECTRQGYAGYHEIMATSEEGSSPCLRWYILSPEGSVILFLHACDSSENRNWYNTVWGALPEEIYSMLYEQ